MSELRRSLLLSFLNKYSILVITIISSMIIARLLTPQEIGVFSVAASLIGIAHTLRDFGVSNYLIQAKDISSNQIRTAFTITAMMAWLIAIILFLSKGWVAEFYNQSELQKVIQILSLNFIILPFSSVTMALLRRDMAFGKIYKITILGAIAQVSTNITLAWLGYGFYSLAWGGFANVFITALSAQIIMPIYANFKPSFKGWKSIVNFGGKLSVASLVNEAGVYAPDIIMGKLLGFVSVGVFSRALGFVSLIDQALSDAIRPVMLPYFSKQNRDSQDIHGVFLKIASYYLGVALPLLCLIALLAYPMIRFLYGPQWVMAAPIAQILCLGMAFKSLNFLLSSVIVAKGHAGAIVKVQMLYQLARVSAVLYGSTQGLSEVAIYLVISEFFGFFVFYSQLSAEIKFKDIFIVIFKNIMISLGCLFPFGVIYFYNMDVFFSDMTGLDSLYIIFVSIIVMIASWVLNIYLFQRELFFNVWGLVSKKL